MGTNGKGRINRKLDPEKLTKNYNSWSLKGNTRRTRVPLDLTLMELETYSWCPYYYSLVRGSKNNGRAYRAYGLKDDREWRQVTVHLMMRYIVSYLGFYGYMPTEDLVMIELASIKARLESMGYKTLFVSVDNDITLAVMQFYHQVANVSDSIQEVHLSYRYIREGVSVLVPSLFLTDTALYMITNKSGRFHLNSPGLLLNMVGLAESGSLINEVKSFHVSISGGLTLNCYTNLISDFNLQNADIYWSGVLAGIANQSYVANYDCQRSQCGHFDKCLFARRRI